MSFVRPGALPSTIPARAPVSPTLDRVFVADTFMAKGKAKSFDAKLAKATKWIGAVFILLTLVLNILP